MHKLLPILALSTVVGIASSPALAAQQLQTDFLVGGPPNAATDVGGGIFSVNTTMGSRTILANLPADLRRTSYLIQDPANPLGWYAGTRGPVKNVPGPVYLYHFTASVGRVITSRKLNTDTILADTEIKSLALVGDQLIFGSDSRVGSVAIAGGATKTLFSFSRTSGNFPAIASDGRYLYTNIFDTGTGYRTGGGSVWRHDLQDLKQRVTLFSVDQFPTNILGLQIDAAGRLYSVDKGNFAAPKLRVHDIRTKMRLHDVTLPWMALRGFMSLGVDPVSDTVVVNGQGISGFSDQNYYSTVVKNWTVGAAFGGVDHPMSAVAARRTPGLVRRGFVCSSKANPEYMTLATGSPNLGNTMYSIDLVGPANAVAILMLGSNAPFTPVKLAPTMCELGVNPFLLLPGAIPAAGKLAVNLPVPMSASGVVIDAQWAILEASANSLGIVTHQVGRVYVR